MTKKVFCWMMTLNFVAFYLTGCYRDAYTPPSNTSQSTYDKPTNKYTYRYTPPTKPKTPSYESPMDKSIRQQMEKHKTEKYGPPTGSSSFDEWWFGKRKDPSANPNSDNNTTPPTPAAPTRKHRRRYAPYVPLHKRGYYQPRRYYSPPTVYRYRKPKNNNNTEPDNDDDDNDGQDTPSGKNKPAPRLQGPSSTTTAIARSKNLNERNVQSQIDQVVSGCTIQIMDVKKYHIIVRITCPTAARLRSGLIALGQMR